MYLLAVPRRRTAAGGAPAAETVGTPRSVGLSRPDDAFEARRFDARLTAAGIAEAARRRRIAADDANRTVSARFGAVDAAASSGGRDHVLEGTEPDAIAPKPLPLDGLLSLVGLSSS